MQLSGGLYTYNRFDEFEKSLNEGKGAKGTSMKNPGQSSAPEMKKKVDKAAKKAKVRGAYLEREDEKEEGKEEKETAEGGDSVSESFLELRMRKGISMKVRRMHVIIK